jgi:mono/diheme cytochrome c family protein
MPLSRLWLLAALPWCAAGAAAPPFEGADLKLGERLLQEHKCNECHAKRVGGDGQAIYRPQGRINSPSSLRTMVEYCSTELKLQLFPEDVEAIAAVLNRDHYHFR